MPMRTANLAGLRGQTYSSNVCNVRSGYNRIADVNTLIDVGNDPSVVERIATISTGTAKRPIVRRTNHPYKTF